MEGYDESPQPREMLVPVNKLLYDEQVKLIRAAETRAKAGISGPYGLPSKPTLSGLRPASSTMPTARPPGLLEAMGLTRSPVELTRAQVSAVDRWAREWDVTRSEAVDHLIQQGGGGSSHLMRSS